MASLNMGQSFDFSVENVDGQITKKSAGNYALGYVKTKGSFIVEYIGRADEDINSEIKKHIGEHKEYQRFKYSYALSSLEAFEKECRNYHDFGENKKLHNNAHPVCPEGSDWKCPVCEK
jgi:hypothetical protein